MPEYAVSRLADAYGDLSGARVVILGAAYRGGVKETAYSGVFATVAALESRGAKVTVHDPLYTREELVGLGLSPHTLGDPVEAAIIQTDHPEYRTLPDDMLPGASFVLDGRNTVAVVPRDLKVVRLGRPDALSESVL
jgi:UDP-N-acetyl-D-mannosaminuronate dehydrogenase